MHDSSIRRTHPYNRLTLFVDEVRQRKNLPDLGTIFGHQVVGSAIVVRRDDPDLASVTDDDVAKVMEWVSRA